MTSLFSRLALLVGFAIAGKELWGRRDKNQIEALWAVALKRPTLYRVTLNRPEPIVKIEGDGARIVGVVIDNNSMGIALGPRMVPNGRGGSRPARGMHDYGEMPL